MPLSLENGVANNRYINQIRCRQGNRGHQRCVFSNRQNSWNRHSGVLLALLTFLGWDVIAGL